MPASTDPLAAVRGHAQPAAVISAAHERAEADRAAPVAASDVITLDTEGRIASVLGFLDRVPAGA